MLHVDSISLATERSLGADIVPVEHRLAVPITFEDVHSLFQFYDDTLPYAADRYGHDLKRLLASDGETFYRALLTNDGEASECYRLPEERREAWWQQRYAKFDRERWPSDILLIDAMDDARAEGWLPSPHIAVAIDRLREIAEAERTRHNDEMEAVWREVAERKYRDDVAAGHRPDFESMTTEQRIEAHESRRILYSVKREALKMIDDARFSQELENAFNHSEVRSLFLGAEIHRKLFPFRDWQRNARTGIPDPTNPDNVCVCLALFMIEVRWNVWYRCVEWRQTPSQAPTPWLPLSDVALNRWLTDAGNTQQGFRPTKDLFKRTIETIAYETPYDPVVERIAAAEKAWDGQPRLLTWLFRACGAPCDVYHQVVGRNIIGGIVKRARHAGCKHDETAIFIGPQDTYKSTMCRILALNDKWFSDSLAFEGSPQNTIPQLFGKLVIELSELDGLQRREVQFIKRFLSAQSDNVTLKYEALSSDHARRCIFIGTSNEDTPLRDATGNRRFLPVHITRRIDTKWLRANIEQLIGEAAALESAGDKFLIPDEALPAAHAMQESARSESDFEIILHDWFGDERAGPAYIMPADLTTALRDAIGRSVPPNQYGAAMRKLGFESVTVRLGEGRKPRAWCRGGMEGARRYILTQDSAGRRKPVVQAVTAGGVVMPFPRSA